MKNLILSWLEDEESKFIFNKRMEYNETGDFEPFKEIIEAYIPELRGNYDYRGKETELVARVKDKSNIWIWGAGINCRRILLLLEEHQINIAGILDKDPNKTEVSGISVHCLDQVDFRQIGCLIISMGDAEVAYSCIESAVSSGMNRKDIELYRECLPVYLSDKQYFDDFIRYDEGECFIDAGVLDLSTSLRFAKYCKEAGVSDFKIYAFEPDDVSYDRCMKIKEKHPELNLHLINAGLYSDDTTIGFDSRGTGISCISEQANENMIKVVKLDSIVKDRVTFIKMDIEGAELEALKGCREIIKRDRPKLAISIYHKKEDMIELPKYIKELVPEYKLYLRHYTNCTAETVLYALPY